MWPAGESLLRFPPENTEVFSYLLCIHSHNEWSCLSCFQVSRVQTRLLFRLSSDMFLLLPPAQILESSHGLCPGCVCFFPLCPFSFFFVSVTISDKCFSLCYFNKKNPKHCQLNLPFSIQKTQIRSLKSFNSLEPALESILAHAAPSKQSWRCLLGGRRRNH